jgi:hypothetical protein
MNVLELLTFWRDVEPIEPSVQRSSADSEQLCGRRLVPARVPQYAFDVRSMGRRQQP